MGILRGNDLCVRILVLSLIVYFNFGTVTSTRAEVEAAHDEGEAASNELDAKNLQDSFDRGTLKMLQFFASLTGNLSKMNQRLDDLERKGEERHEKTHEELKEIALRLRSAEEHLSALPNISQRMDDLGRLQDNHRAGLDKILERFDALTGTLSKMNNSFEDLGRVGKERFEELKEIVLRPRSAPEHLRRLLPAKTGNTFNGKTIEAISRAIPGGYAVTVQIVNYLETPLEDYKLHLPQGQVFNAAPRTVPANTREVFTFKTIQSGSFWGSPPHGVFSYKLAGQNFYLHLHFYSGSTSYFGMAFLPAYNAVDTIFGLTTNWSRKPFGWPYEYTGEVNEGTVKTKTIHKDEIYAKVTLQSEEKAKVKVEIFSFEP